MGTKQQLETELEEAYARIDELESYIAQGSELLGDEEESDDENEDGE